MAIGERIRAWRVEQAEASVEKFHRMKGEGCQLDTGDVEQLLADCWLAPITADGPLLLPAVKPPEPAATHVAIEQTEPAASPDASDDSGESAATVDLSDESGLQDSSTEADAESTTRQAPIRTRRPKTRPPSRTVHQRLKRKQRRRASDHAILSMPFEKYLETAQWAAEQTLANKNTPAGQDGLAEQERLPPPQLASRLRESRLDPDRWYSAVDHFQEWFHRVVGPASKLAVILARSGRRWRHGVRRCRDVFT